jgi:menaquinol-cytochrome c reductase iron-sulfur subunit
MTRRSLSGLLVAAGSLFVAGVIGIPVLLTGLSPALQPRRREAWRPVGRLDDFAAGAMHRIVVATEGNVWPRSLRQHAVFVWRRSETDLVVFSQNCTDLGCPLDYDPGSRCFFCPCHGGIFAQDGERLAGPPNGPMHRYAHRVQGEMIEIDVTSIPPSA